MIEPVYAFKRGVFDGVHGFAGAFPPDDFGLVVSIDRLGEGVVIAATETAVRRLEACFCDTLRMPYTEILAAAIRVMGIANLHTNIPTN